ncbi:MAG: SdrD B-like domain-containing protein, partial [Candidatus Methylomirabilaceae bacterium]
GDWDITLTSGQTDSGNDFGNFRQATKSGTKFNDLNANGVRDATDPVLPGWTINLAGTDGLGNAVNLTDVTDASGNYSFSVNPGIYTVSEVLQSGWLQTYPDIPGDGDWDIVLTSGQVDSGNDFGNFQPGVCGLTPGFWAQHLWAWDGDATTDGPVDGQGRTLASKLVADDVLTLEDVLIPVDSDGDGDIDGSDLKGVLVGDANMNGLTGVGETTLFFGLQDAQELINASSQLINADQRVKMARDALALQLNINNDVVDPAGLITEAAKWLSGLAPYLYASGTGDVDTNNDGIADFNNSSEAGADGFAGTKVRANQAPWQTVVANGFSGSSIHEAIDDFNNCRLVGGNNATGEEIIGAVANDVALIGISDQNLNLGDWQAVNAQV